jgi:hypothetical protein
MPMDTQKIVMTIGGALVIALQGYISSQVPGIERTENRLITGEQKLSESLTRGEDNIVERLAALSEKQTASLANLEDIATKLQNSQSADFNRLIESVRAGQTEYQTKILDTLQDTNRMIKEEIERNRKKEEPKK